MDPELEELPTDYLRGLDFRVTKGAKGGFADYSSSKWARKESALLAVEQAAIEQYGLFDLSTFLPKRPTEIELKVIAEMFEASVDGQSYDAERWGQYFRPAGLQAPASQSSAAPAPADDEEFVPTKPTPAATSSSFDDEDDMPAASAPVAASAAAPMNPADILARIKARQKT